MLIEREFSEEGDLEKALDLVNSSNGIALSRKLASQHGELALQHLDCLQPSESSKALAELVDYVLSRIF